MSLGFLFSVAACGSDKKEAVEAEEETETSEEEVHNEAVEDEVDDVASDAVEDDMNNTVDDTEVSEKSNSNDLPEPIVLNERVEHEIGVIFELEKITFMEDHILVDFTAENHSGFNHHLAADGKAQGDSLGGVTLEDDTGFFYRYHAGDNWTIHIEDREKVTATVSFTGRIKDDANTLTLKFNEDNEPDFTFEDIEIPW